HSRSRQDRLRRRAVGLTQKHTPACRRDPERRLTEAEDAKRLHNAIARLEKSHRQVIQMAYFEDLTQAEMAQRLRKPLGTIKAWTRSALRQLRVAQITSSAPG